MPDSSKRLNIFLKEYLSILKLEKNLSDNTVASYGNDINSFLQFVESRKIDDPSIIKQNHIADFFKSLKELGLSGRSAARYYSSIKGFFNYLFLSKYITENPIGKISSPKLAKNLPPVLSVREIDLILSKPDTDNKLGLRDKAVLELLYACGTRVSELINIKISDLFFDDEVIRVFGKGSKERIIPIGRSAIMWTNKYLKESRVLLMKKTKSENYLFLNNRGTKLSRMGVWKKKFIPTRSGIPSQLICWREGLI